MCLLPLSEDDLIIGDLAFYANRDWLALILMQFDAESSKYFRLTQVGIRDNLFTETYCTFSRIRSAMLVVSSSSSCWV